MAWSKGRVVVVILAALVTSAAGADAEAAGQSAILAGLDLRTEVGLRCAWRFELGRSEGGHAG